MKKPRKSWGESDRTSSVVAWLATQRTGELIRRCPTIANGVAIEGGGPLGRRSPAACYG
jgi:hypothetical protein